MSWKDIGIEDPGLKWDNFGLYQDWNSHKLSELFEKTEEEIDDYQAYLYELFLIGLFENQVDSLTDWIEHIEDLLKKASNNPIGTRDQLIDIRIQLSKFKRHYDCFVAQIESLGETDEINDN